MQCSYINRSRWAIKWRQYPANQIWTVKYQQLLNGPFHKRSMILHLPRFKQFNQHRLSVHKVKRKTITFNNLLNGVADVQAPVENTEYYLTCLSCHEEVITNVKYTSTTKTHVAALLFCLEGCICCVPLPYFDKAYKNANHYCPKCGVFIKTNPPEAIF